jgi:putative copper export protein/mono/diheme cytochrome c family protein/peroxiredoxin
MNEAIFLFARGLHQGGGLILLGSLGFVIFCLPRERGLTVQHRRALGFALAAGVIALFAGVLVFVAQIATLPQTGLPLEQNVSRLLFESRFGKVWMLREALLLAACLLLAATLLARASGTAPAMITLALAGVALAAAPFSGHSATAEPLWPALGAHTTHLLAAGLWFGALPFMCALALQAARGDSLMRALAISSFARFSKLALPLMALIVASGIWLAIVHVQTYPALFGTAYGWTLLAKILLLSGVLASAAQLRWKLLPRLSADAALGKNLARWMLCECLIAVAVVLLATQIARTIPAAHDAINWRLPFRFSMDANLDTQWIPIALSCAGVAAIGLALAAWHFLRRRKLSGVVALGGTLFVCGGVGALTSISIEAYPDTYRRPSVPYQTISVAAGAQLFQTHCTDCHGTSGHGDGPSASAVIPAANLTEPHTALHTAGDMFWWLTHGKNSMPGFAAVLSEDERWDLINFLRTLSAGYQARILGERPVPLKPWLGAIDFSYTDQHGNSAALKDYRQHGVVLLVFFSSPGSDTRMRELAQHTARLEAAGAKIIALSVDGKGGEKAAVPYAIVAEGGEETVRAYGLLRRTLADADPQDQAPVPAHMELLVDRFGYARARWLPRESEAWRDIERLSALIMALAAEPEIKPPPDDHVH